MAKKNSKKSGVISRESLVSRTLLSLVAKDAPNREHYLAAAIVAVARNPEPVEKGVADPDFKKDFAKNGRAIVRRVLGGVRKSDGAAYGHGAISPSWLATAYKVVDAHSDLIGKLETSGNSLTLALNKIENLHKVPGLLAGFHLALGAAEKKAAAAAVQAVVGRPETHEMSRVLVPVVSASAPPPPVEGLTLEQVIEAEVQRRLKAMSPVVPGVYQSCS